MCPLASRWISDTMGCMSNGVNILGIYLSIQCDCPTKGWPVIFTNKELADYTTLLS
jgi:hypothetical protein